MDSTKWLKVYPVDSLQIYFAASLELQEELIKHGFQVPKSHDGKIKMSIPLIYANFRGWLIKPEPITIERLIPPEWLNLNTKDLNWEEEKRDNKRAYRLPPEEVYVKIGVANNTIIFDLDIKSYHLERISIRGVNPEKWTNWVMFYIDVKYLDDLIETLKGFLPNSHALLMTGISKPEEEQQQGGKEVTYYVKVPVKDFSLCLGCFDLALKYLYIKAEEHKAKKYCSLYPKICGDPGGVVNELKLRLEYDNSTGIFAKVGVAKIKGKRHQIMIKLASEKPHTISGVLKNKITGKARGKLVYCDHKEKRQYIALDLVSFWKALNAVKPYINKLPKD